MQKQVKISNFRKESIDLELKDLSGVSYLVGENNSGKTSVLDCLHYNSLKHILKDFTNFEELSGKSYSLYKNSQAEANFNVKEIIYVASYNNFFLFSNKNSFEDSQKKLNSDYNYYFWGVKPPSVGQDKNSTSKISLIVEDFKNWIIENLPEEDSLTKTFEKAFFWQTFETEDSAGIVGFKYFFCLIEELYYKYRHQNILVLFEQIEGCFHPKWEKLLPKLFTLVVEKTGINFIIATHSPFIISASGELTDLEKYICNCLNKDFEPSQKVYLLKNGKTISKSGREGGGNYGYWGGKANYVASNILGVGLSDMYKKVNRKPDPLSPILIICEGQSKDEDAKFYNHIFKNYHRSSLFVSSQGSSTVETSFKLLQEIKQGLYANFEILMLRDRDHHYPADADIQKVIQNNPNQRILKRRAIELYIYDPEITQKWLESWGIKLPNNLKIEILNAHKKVEQSVNKGIAGFDYKGLLVNEVFRKKIYPFYQKEFNKTHPNKEPISFDKLDDELVKFITPKTQSYKEFEKVVFRGV
jgi:predicted ATPase